MSVCGLCGASFGCAMLEAETGAGTGAGAACWCTLLPAVAALPQAQGSACWCPACLQAHIVAHAAHAALAPAGPVSGQD